MAKILLVEDDNNLREIFEMRLKAEGYTIVTAHDGEQALVVAMQEKQIGRASCRERVCYPV